MSRTVYDPRTWADTFVDDPRAEPLRAWLEANNIVPDDVPTDHVIRIDGEMILHTAFHTAPDGAKIAYRDGALLKARAVPLTEQPPSELFAWAATEATEQPR
jgi:hypothetical protein